MNNTIYDVIIVGSGPAGSSAAYELARNGIHTAILEKEQHPRNKPCGGGLVFKARKMIPFDISGIAEREFYSGVINLVKENMGFTVTREQPVITIVKREIFDRVFCEHSVAEGAELFENCPVEDISNGSLINISTTHGVFRSRFVIAADGALSRTAKLCGWKDSRHIIPTIHARLTTGDKEYECIKDMIRFDIGVIPNGYGWLFPGIDGISIGLATTKRSKADLKGYYKRYIDYLGISGIDSEIFFGYVIPLSPRRDGFFRNNVLLAGDAAGFADPVTAEGISNAILSGKLAAESVINGWSDSREVELLFQKKLNESILPQLKIARYLAKLFYNNDWLRKRIFAKKGQKLSEFVTDIFMGTRHYPINTIEYARSKIKTLL